MPEPQGTLAGVLAKAQEGIGLAEEMVRAVAARRALGEPVLAEGVVAEPSADMARDVIELSQAAVLARASTQVFRLASGLSLDVVNLGRRIDVRV